MGIYVDGYFLRQDIHWTPDDIAAFGRHLEDRDIRVVLHKWEPAEPIRAAIEAADAKLVVLETGEIGTVEDGHLVEDGYERLLEANLALVYEALRAANQ
jgi:hypothetical protein